MSPGTVMVVVLAVYFVTGLLLAYRFVTKELPGIFAEQLDEEEGRELSKAREELYDSFHNLNRMVGAKGVLAVIFLGGMLFWLPIWMYERFSS